MPQFDLTTNVKDLPANFHKETTELVAQLLGKPSMVSSLCCNDCSVRWILLCSNLQSLWSNLQSFCIELFQSLVVYFVVVQKNAAVITNVCFRARGKGCRGGEGVVRNHAALCHKAPFVNWRDH